MAIDPNKRTKISSTLPNGSYDDMNEICESNMVKQSVVIQIGIALLKRELITKSLASIINDLDINN